MKYNPHDYQIYAINFIKEHPIAAILLDMGMGKTSIVLAALNDLMFDSFEVTKVLIIAPLRVAKHTWSAEIQKWDQLRGLRYSIAVGTAAERMKALQADADIYIINRENALEDLSASTGSNTLCPIRRTVRLFTAIGSGRVLTRGFMTESPISRFP